MQICLLTRVLNVCVPLRSISSLKEGQESKIRYVACIRCNLDSNMAHSWSSEHEYTYFFKGGSVMIFLHTDRVVYVGEKHPNNEKMLY